MPHRLILKFTKFQLPPPKRLGTVVKNILGGHHAPPPPPQCQIGLNSKKPGLNRPRSITKDVGSLHPKLYRALKIHEIWCRDRKDVNL